MGRPDIPTVLLQGVALALLVLVIAVAPAALTGGVLLSGSPPLQRLVADHLRRFGPDLATSVHVDLVHRGG